jgi:phosphatidylglycerol lysyltransferase
MTRPTKEFDASVPERAALVADELALVLEQCGSEAGQYNVLGPDPWQVLWNDDRSGFIGFLEGRKCLLVWRSPVAHPDEQGQLLVRLLVYGLKVNKAVFALVVNDATRAVGEDYGMVSIWMGTESYLDLATWSLEGTRRHKVRWAMNQGTRNGLTWREAFPFVDGFDREGIARVEVRWKAERTERRTDSFLRTSFEELGEYRRYFVCERFGEIIAFVACTPVSKKGWYLQDVVRLANAPRGALEGAMAHALAAFQKDGYDFASNGALPFWEPGESWSDPHQFGFIGNMVVRFFNHQYRFRAINQFRSKFAPDRIERQFVLRSQLYISPGVARSLIKLLKKHPGTNNEGHYFNS